MISDFAWQMSTEQSLVAGGDILSDDWVNIEKLGDVGVGEELYMHVHVDESFVGGTVSLIAQAWVFPYIEGIITAPEEAVVLAGAARLLAQYQALVQAELTAGKSFFLPISGHGSRLLVPFDHTGFSVWKWVRARYSVSAGLSTGKVTTNIVRSPSHEVQTFPKGAREVGSGL